MIGTKGAKRYLQGDLMAKLRTRMLAAASGGLLALAGALVVTPQAQALGPVPARACTSADSYYSADEFLHPSYEAIGSTIGKYNGSPSVATLSYAQTTTETKTTGW